MEKIKFNTKYLEGFVVDEDFRSILPEIEKAHSHLENKDGAGKDFLGWLDLPEETPEGLLSDIQSTADKMNSTSDVIIVIGIGGSYLGARAAIETLSPEFFEQKIFFAGHYLSGDHMCQLLESVKDRDVSVNVISKSGTTTEPAVAFRIVEEFMKKKYTPGQMKERVVCTTDKEKGALKSLADTKGYKTFVIPDDVGGRFSVLTPVGLLPVACAGINIRDLVDGAREQVKCVADPDLDKNISYKYAAVRNIFYRKGKKIEILSGFDHKFGYIAEWWKQLFGESEGKEGHGIYPTACRFTTDLHSMGQLIQEGERNIFETFLVTEKESENCLIPTSDEDIDGLNYLAGKQIDFVNKKAYEATAEAHFEGGVPNTTIFIPDRTAYYLGALFYFFEKAVAVSAYVNGVNPFNQPGVEAYKKKMFRLLGRPGY